MVRWRNLLLHWSEGHFNLEIDSTKTQWVWGYCNSFLTIYAQSFWSMHYDCTICYHPDERLIIHARYISR